MNKLHKQLDIKRFLHQNKVGLYGLVEHKIKGNDYDGVLSTLGQHWSGIHNYSHHQGGRVWIIWITASFNVNLVHMSSQQITVRVEETFSGDCFLFTIVYGHNDDIDRRELWRDLKDIKDNYNGAWGICGDFNSLLHFNEREGRPVLWSEIYEFRDCVDYCEIVDIKGQGALFTWNNKHEPNSRVFSRLDRFMVNTEWMQLYPECYAYFLPEGLYDHNPCLCYKRAVPQRKTHFRYFCMWGQDPNFTALIQEKWKSPIAGTAMFKVVKKLQALKKPLRELNRHGYSDIGKDVGIAKLILDKLQEQMNLDPTNLTILAEEQVASDDYRHLSKAYHSFLSQKAKINWLQEGDENTQFFHSQINARQMQNKVLQIKDKDGILHSNFKNVEHAFLDYYETLLGTCKSTTPVHFPTIRTGNLINAQHQQILLKPLLKQINTTTITLIPKVKHPVSVLEYRPIACCNILYKSIAKILCNRLSEVLPDIISSSQRAFIKGRNIVDNVLICQDLVRLYNRQAASPRCLIKIDLRKAYDTVEWDFVEQMLTAMRFPQNFVKLVMVCITTPSYSLAINGSSFGFFKGRRGLRQGDPLSPLIFTLCMEYLSRILGVVANQDGFRYHPMCGHIKLNHLLFADDLLLFCKGTEAAIMWMLRGFATFSASSGLCLNNEKTDIYFNGVPGYVIDNIIQIYGFKRGTLPFKYLGVPISSKKLTKNDCAKLTDKIMARIRAWGTRHLSYAGRLVLVNAVLTSLHSYWATIFLIPNGVMKRIDSLCRTFLWEGKDSYSRAPNVHWDT
ncbi:uncharacterized protein LOC141631739 [Silene latifolia]|uniref:uncharacterized protein LOC141631739 n=1 Tax=Silene latifolia TaxID=37657 RepID=UPI003D76E740